MSNNPIEDAIDAELLKFMRGEVSTEDVYDRIADVVEVLEDEDREWYLTYASIMLAELFDRV